MKRLWEKIKSLPRTYYIIGVPLFCGIIIGTVLTLSIPKIKADTSLVGATSNQVSSTANPTSVPEVTSAPATQPTSIPSTIPSNEPTNAPVQQNNTNTSQSVQQVVSPCK